MLVDTSVRINHFSQANGDLEQRLDEGRIATHPFVIGELACGSLRQLTDVLHLIEALPFAPVATYDEVLAFIERQHLSASGLGWIDMHLLASARLARQSLWSADRHLRETATRLGLTGAE